MSLVLFIPNDKMKLKSFSLMAKDYITKNPPQKGKYLIQCTICGSCQYIDKEMVNGSNFIYLLCTNQLHSVFRNTEIEPTTWKVIAEF